MNSYEELNKASLEVQLEAVKEDAALIQFIENPCLEVQLEAVKENGYAVRYIANPCSEVQLEAVKQNGSIIQYIENPSLELLLLAYCTEQVKKYSYLKQFTIDKMKKFLNKNK
jgi:hypothetical protein